MKVQRLRVLEIGASILVVVGIATHAWCQSTFTVRDVLKASELRQKRVQSARFYFDETRFVAKGSIAMPGRAIRPEGSPVPKEDLSYRTSQIVTINGPKIRYSRDGQALNMLKGEIVEQSTVMAYDGERVKNYTAKGAVDHPTGTILSGAPQDTTLISLLPLFLVYRATYPGLRLPFKISEFEKTEEMVAIDGRNCVALRLYRRPPARGEDTLWVDAGRDFLMKRYTSSLNGKVHLQLDINYENDARHGWVPSKWRFVYYQSGGGFSESGDTKVTKYEINNAINANEFDLIFPPGTLVNEDKEGQIVKYIAKEGDDKRVITEADKGKSYQDVLNEGSKRIGVWMAVFGLFATGLIIAFAIPLFRRFSRSRRVSA